MNIIHAQTVLAETDLEKLKKESGQHTTKEALQTAVEHFLNCPYSSKDIDDLEERIKTIKED